jgi:hypothetical protein
LVKAKEKLMRRTYAGLVALLFLGTVRLAEGACTPSETGLCLNAGRFAAEVAWKDSRGRTGVGTAVPITGDTGYFWFFSPANIELVIKVLDARSVNGKYWVFFGALSNVEYTLTVTDMATGAKKIYENASGHFASVGDTSAFNPDGTAGASPETVRTEGTDAPPETLAAVQGLIDSVFDRSADGAWRKDASDATPCPGGATYLYLSNCRFRLDVRWTDSHDRTGAGQAVAVTPDTGYFWFFSETNVELMVKVLDARAVNGQFWVFFGALSNVEYTIDVVDTVSGAIRSYHNPQGAFASVGDTAAFRGGFGVSIETDGALAETGLITVDGGGVVSAIAADGTVFTLDVPRDAINQDEEITMTPARATGPFPFAGGLAAGVDLQPAGLVFLDGATLTIETPSTIPLSEETPVAWNGSGEDFFLFPPVPAPGVLQLRVFSLGGYGVARGTDAEREAQLGREPLGDDDLLSHQISPSIRAGRVAAAAAPTTLMAATTDWRVELKARLDSQYQSLKTRMKATDGDPSTVVGLVRSTLQWKGWVFFLGPLETVFPGRTAEIRALFERILGLALKKIHAECSADVNKITDLPKIIELMRRPAVTGFGVNVQALQNDVKEALKCLTFQLTYTSKIDELVKIYSGDVTVTYAVRAQVTLRSVLNPSGRFDTLGGAIQGLQFTKVSVTGLPGRCTYHATSAGADFDAYILWPSNLYDDNQTLSIREFTYSPGLPRSNITTSCTAPGDLDPFSGGLGDEWTTDYYNLHLDDLFGDPNSFDPFVQRAWSIRGGGNPWATAHSDKSNPDLRATEDTTFELVHTPE